MELNKMLEEYKEQIFDNIYCAMIVKIVKVYDGKKVDVKPLYIINGEPISQIVQVPLAFLGNDRNIIQVESEVGDKALVIISDYDIDNVVISGEEKETNVKTMHKIDDAICIPFSFTPYNSNKAQTSKIMMNKDGSIDILAEGNFNITTTGTSDVNIDCNTYNVTQRGV